MERSGDEDFGVRNQKSDGRCIVCWVAHLEEVGPEGTRSSSLHTRFTVNREAREMLLVAGATDPSKLGWATRHPR